MIECSCSFPGFPGVGNQNFSSLSSGRSTCISALMYVTTSSRSVRRFRAAMLTGRITFVSSGFKICNSATLVSVAIVYGKSVVLAILVGTFLSQAVVIAVVSIGLLSISRTHRTVVRAVLCQLLDVQYSQGSMRRWFV